MLPSRKDEETNQKRGERRARPHLKDHESNSKNRDLNGLMIIEKI